MSRPGAPRRPVEPALSLSKETTQPSAPQPPLAILPHLAYRPVSNRPLPLVIHQSPAAIPYSPHSTPPVAGRPGLAIPASLALTASNASVASFDCIAITAARPLPISLLCPLPFLPVSLLSAHSFHLSPSSPAPLHRPLAAHPHKLYTIRVSLATPRSKCPPPSPPRSSFLYSRFAPSPSPSDLTAPPSALAPSCPSHSSLHPQSCLTSLPSPLSPSALPPAKKTRPNCLWPAGP